MQENSTKARKLQITRKWARCMIFIMLTVIRIFWGEEPDTFYEIAMLKKIMICSKILRLIGLGGGQEGLLLMYFL